MSVIAVAVKHGLNHVLFLLPPCLSLFHEPDNTLGWFVENFHILFQERYASFQMGIGARIADGTASMEDCEVGVMMYKGHPREPCLNDHPDNKSCAAPHNVRTPSPVVME